MSGGAANGASGDAQQSEEHTLQAEEELRIEVAWNATVFVTLLEGSAEVSVRGSPVRRGAPALAPAPRRRLQRRPNRAGTPGAWRCARPRARALPRAPPQLLTGHAPCARPPHDAQPCAYGPAPASALPFQPLLALRASVVSRSSLVPRWRSSSA